MVDQAHQESLADLCTVCYNSQPKYKCPRCKTQTCSLPCYKRHQQRASCNGQRDPAAFVKKSAWATPSGIDHDYNYLKSVERKVDSAWQDVQERGIGNRNAPRVLTTDATTTEVRLGEKQVAKAWLPGSALQRYLGDHTIHVERAPAGMSRQRANRTRVTNKAKVFWTVEWVDAQGTKTMDDEGAGDATISELWSTVEARRRNAERGRKRKRSQESAEPALPQTAAEEASTAIDERPFNFYLQKPMTAVKARVLIPISPDDTLTKALEHRTVLEYPTIYALHEDPESLLDDYMLEKDYNGASTDAPWASSIVPPLQEANADEPGDTGQLLDATSILDMLSRDIGAR